MNNKQKQLTIDGKTKLFGLFGDPVEHSLSPVMHNAAFREKGLNCCYLPFRVFKEDLPAAVKSIVALGLKGINITAPHKEAVVQYLDELSSEAAFLQAVNTVLNNNGRLIGYNTDVYGFQFLLQNNIKDAPQGGKACLLGAGGAARAVCLALFRAGVEELVIVNRTPVRAEELAALLIAGGIFKKGKVSVVEPGKDSLRESLAEASLVINALSEDPVKVGFLPDEDLFLPGCKALIDLRYALGETPFKLWARKRGLFFVEGLDMLLGQGLKAFEIFTGEMAPLPAMREALQWAVYNRPKP